MHGWCSRSVLVLAMLAAMAMTACGGGAANPKKPPERSTLFMMQMADSQARAGRISEALATLDEALAKDPDNAVIHNRYGQICLNSNRLAEAETALRKALEFDPYMTDARNNLGVLYSMKGRSSEAEKEFNLALEDPAYPTPEKVHLNLAILRLDQGRDSEAETHLRRGLEINPKFSRAHYELATLLERTGNLEEAAREYEVIETAFRTSGEYWYRRGFTSYRLNLMQRAREYLLRVRSVAPGSEWVAKADKLLAVMD